MDERPGARGVQPLETEFEAQLGGEGDADGGAGAEEVTECATWDAELFDAGDRRGLRAGGAVETERRGVCEAIDRSRESGDVADVVVAGILAVEEIEKFGEGAERDSFAQRDITADAEIYLIKGCAAKLV